MSKLPLVTLLITGLMALSASKAFGQVASQSQTLNQDLNISCTVGAYGGTSSCSAEGSQSGTQSQYLELGTNRNLVCRQDGNCFYEHQPINAGVDAAVALPAGVAGAGMIAIGAITLKKRK